MITLKEAYKGLEMKGKMDLEAASSFSHSVLRWSGGWFQISLGLRWLDTPFRGLGRRCKAAQRTS